MICNQCGKDNSDGTKFCVQCGAKLYSGQANTYNPATMPNQAAASTATESNTVITAGTKTLLICVTVIVLLIIAAVNILKVRAGITRVSIINELQQANTITTVRETNSYIYYASDALYRMDKSSNTVTKVSNKAIYPSVATSNGIYGLDDSGNCYKVSDKSDDIEKVDGIVCSNTDNIFLSEQYNYVVSMNGTITKKLNSNKYGNYSIVLYEGDSGESIACAPKMYKNYIYMILSDSSSYSDNRFIRVSLKTGKEEELTDSSISGFSFADDIIVCNDSAGGFFAINLDGGNEQEYTEIKSVKGAPFICANNYVYYADSNKLYRFSIAGGRAEELGTAYYGLTEINGGFVVSSGDELTLIDYDGNKVSTVEP